MIKTMTSVTIVDTAGRSPVAKQAARRQIGCSDRFLGCTVLWLSLCLLVAAEANDLDASFVNPPEESKPWCYWYWLNNDISKEGVTRDLEAMARVGIKRAMIGNIEGGGPVKMFSDEWYDVTHHALKEANRLSVELMSFNAPGWSQSGGPWIAPEQSMRRVAWQEFPARGGAFSQRVRPAGLAVSQDIAVLAVPRLEAVSIVGSKRGDSLYFGHTEPFPARALVVHGTADARLYALQHGQRTLVAHIQTGGSNPTTDFLPAGIETFSFKEVTAQAFELVPDPNCEVVLTSEPKVAQVIEKQLGRMHPTPSPTWESYRFPETVEPQDTSTVVKQTEIIDLSDKLDAQGLLTCTLPEGQWTVIYFGMQTTGKENSPAPPEATGLECDKMSRAHTEYHFHAMFDRLLGEMTPEEKAAFKGITIDSYEKGAQNWTDGFAEEFERRNGYDPMALLPVMTGRVVDSAKTSDRFLWDLRRTVADMIAENYVGGLRDIAHEHGLSLWSENYGHWGFPGEFLIYGGYSDEIGGEFWTNQNLGTIECRAASSAAHIYGKRRVYAEAFTSSLDLGHHPYIFKARGEELFCEGINHFVLHVYALQTRDGVPGKNPWFGTAFHRNTPWFMEARDWVTYLQRCHTMLQQGDPVADVAVYIGDFAPQMTGPANPVPQGYDYDYVGSDAILRKLQVVNGQWVVYDEQDPMRIAARYQRLAMPQVKYIRPHVLARLEALRQQGGKVIDGVPVTAAALQAAGVDPIVSDTSCDIRWKARQLENGMMFFLSNFEKAGPFEATLRVSGRVPELFNPVTGQITKLARFQSVKHGTRICFNVKDKSDSCFVVLREETARPSVVEVKVGGQEVSPADLDLFYDPDNRLTAQTARAGSYTLTMSDGTRRQLVIEQGAQTFMIEGAWQATQKDEKGFSVVQAKTFDLPSAFGKGQRVTLDLGQVSIMAKVTLNDTVFDTLWMPPFTLDVTDVLHPGNNRLQVLVTSTSKGKPALGRVALKTAIRKTVVR
ncbi:MAG: hypothetical protein K9N55_03840 [Phycisphaerae bacterium]|nr:hypothetical protein [Phycisphaerae bacterium]